jgi:hypothetical protein
MTQLSRPFQIALVAMGLLAAVWFLALRGHSSSTSGSGSPASASSASAAGKSAASSPVYHGSAPGVEGLTRAIAKAHGAVAESERNAKALQEKSAQASGSTSTAAAPGSSTAGASTAGSQATSSVASKSSATTGTKVTHPALKANAAGAGTPITRPNTPPGGQLWVERELNQRHTVALLFLNPTGADDIRVRHELELLIETQTRSIGVGGREVGNESAVPEPPGPEETLAMRVARASQVSSFGSFTRAVRVDQTPTVLLVNPRGQATALPGLLDAFAVEQAVDTLAQP